MAGIPALCQSCGAIFESPAAIVLGGGTIDLSGGTTDCPRCGGEAKFVDGTLTDRGRGLEIVSAPPLTHAILDRLKGVAERAQAGQISKEEAIREAEAVSPTIAKVFKLFLNAGLPVLSALIALMALYIQYEESVSSEEFEAEALTLLRRQANSMEIIASQQATQNFRTERLEPLQKKTKTKIVVQNKKSERRKIVRQARKKELAERRKAFNTKSRD